MEVLAMVSIGVVFLEELILNNVINYIKFFVVTFLCFSTLIGYSQLPGTNVYALDISSNGDRYDVKNPTLLTSFNASGYNNQPSYVGNEIFLTSNWKEEGQTDIIALDFNNKSVYRVTATAESEYSPVMMPDNEHFSVVRVEQNENNTQVLWQYPVDRSSNGKKVLDDVTTVGYYTWLNSYLLAMFLVDDPHKLVIRNIFADHNKVIASDVGRSLHTRGGNLFYVEKVSRKFWYIKHYNPNSEETTTITATRPGREDFVILSDGTLVMGDRSLLFKYNARTDKEWVLMNDLAEYGIRNITRLAHKNGQLLIVDSIPK